VDDTLSGLTLFWVVGSGIMAGLFFTFSTFMMKSLSQGEASQGIATMQSINRDILNPLFFVAFMGTALSSLVLGVVSLTRWHEASAVFRFAGSTFYMIGVIGVTMAYHIPRNDALAKIDPASAQAPAAWSKFLSEWTPSNHVRTIAAIAALLSFVAAYRRS
jgi:uncharacterized membrane protein